MQKRKIALLIISSTSLLLACHQKAKPAPEEKYYSTDDYYTVRKYDVHTHDNVEDPYFIKHCLADNFSLLELNVDVPDYPPILTQRKIAEQNLKNFPGRFAFTTALSVTGWNNPDWQAKTLAYLKESFDQGAIGVKVWKIVGMELKDKNGKFVMIDNPRFDTIIDFIEKSGKTLVGHLGEPKNCWLPLSQMTVNNDKEYYASHPEYHMFLHPEYPSYMDQINARDHMLEKHPNLRFDGAHLGSLEWNTDELAKRLDKFPNMAVDMAERISHLEYQSQKNFQKLYDFFIKYQDRLMYATDLEVNSSMDSTEAIKHAHDTHVRHWQFFTSNDSMQAPEVDGKFKALHLPKEVVDKIYRTNAEKWFPGFNPK